MRPLVVIFVSLSLILCLLSMTTHYRYERIEDEYNSDLLVKCSDLSPELSHRICYRLSYTHSRGLAISALVFLSISLITMILSWLKPQDRLLAYLAVLFLLISSLLLISSYILHPREEFYHRIGHSGYLMLVSSLITFLSTILTSFVAQTIS